MDSGGLTRNIRVRRLRGRARGTDKSNVDSEDTKYRKDILNTTTVEQRR